jgi:hypothetical protein
MWFLRRTNYRILTPRLPVFRTFVVRFFRNANYRFLTPPTKDSEFRIRDSEWVCERGVKNR